MSKKRDFLRSEQNRDKHPGREWTRAYFACDTM